MIEEKVKNLIEKPVNDMGILIDSIEYIKEGNNYFLRIIIDRDKIIEEIKEYIEKYFERNTSKNSRLIYEWVLTQEYRINEKPIVTDKDREEWEKDLRILKEKYYKLTNEALNIFEYENKKGVKLMGDEFVEKIFNKP